MDILLFYPLYEISVFHLFYLKLFLRTDRKFFESNLPILKSNYSSKIDNVHK